jgi:hypothetical protein
MSIENAVAEQFITDGLEIQFRIDEGQADATFLGNDGDDRLFELTIPGKATYWFEGAGGGGGGGGGAAGRGAGKGQSGCGAGGNGAYCKATFALDLNAGDRLILRLGHGGRGGAGAPALMNWGSSGARGADTIVTLNEAVLLTFAGSNPGGGAHLPPGDRGGMISGVPGDTTPPNGNVNYFYSGGGRQGQQGGNVDLPRGGRGGAPGDSNGGGGGGASLRGTGGHGGAFVRPCTAGVGSGLEGHFGSGGGGGAGGGDGSCDTGHGGGAGGQGYIWIYRIS